MYTYTECGIDKPPRARAKSAVARVYDLVYQSATQGWGGANEC